MVCVAPTRNVRGRESIPHSACKKCTNTILSYKLAEKLQDRLNELNKDLTEMIEEINSTSQTLSKTGKPDDPVRFPSRPPPIQTLTPHS